MKLITENYTIESDHHGYSLIVKLPSDNEKSKTGFTEKKTFHADLHQVAKKIIAYELAQADYNDLQILTDMVDRSADRLAAALVTEVAK